jgi:hypothetical protein
MVVVWDVEKGTTTATYREMVFAPAALASATIVSYARISPLSRTIKELRRLLRENDKKVKFAL